MLCEGGADEYTDESQECYLGTIDGDPYFDLDTARLRYLGGSTNHWGGWCRTFDASDFNRSDISEELVWPIRKPAIDPYFEEACGIVDVPPEFSDGLPNKFGVKQIGFNFSPPTLFGEKYYDEIKDSANIKLYLNANLVDVALSNNRMTSAEFLSFDTGSLTVRAKTFVFAMGGIENSRMLIWLRGLHGDALHDPRLPVGEYWMEHPTFELGEALVETEIADKRYFGLSEEVQRDQGIMNCGLIIDGVSKKRTSQLVYDLLCLAPGIGQKLMDLADRRLICGGKIRSAWEQMPTKSNRVTLSGSETDRFGIPRPVLHWKKSDFDRRTVVKSLQVFNEWLLDSDLGRIRIYDWVLSNGDYPLDDVLAGHHHIGGTRMGENPEISVVDADARVFGTENLYMAGSSIFTTSGHTNPTLPIVQFSLRLADHLLGK
ncbi:GMC family oxidoreductase [Sinisalibacter aestuarii]|uniref:Dehydrogenase n=1 Tax=Sinisalibacter aestuarii TaxID=2949426 RepID=A0ABQ5LT31_9RHOB|nr:GMC family oxidoreductase [Sinisalibacter aestuarii]GKY88154.1 dehydrogenase [Sinisalibacter aestuarii]